MPENDGKNEKATALQGQSAPAGGEVAHDLLKWIHHFISCDRLRPCACAVSLFFPNHREVGSHHVKTWVRERLKPKDTSRRFSVQRQKKVVTPFKDAMRHTFGGYREANTAENIESTGANQPPKNARDS